MKKINKINLNKINYQDKENFKELPTIPDYQKSSAQDFNQIKEITNLAIDELNLNVNPAIEDLNLSTVKITGNQLIDGLKTFISAGGAITFNAIDKAQFFEIKNNNIRVCFFGKGSSLNNNITLESSIGSLNFNSRTGISFNNNDISGIKQPTNNDNPANKIYVDDLTNENKNSINNIEIILNDLINEIDSLRPFEFKGEYSSTINYKKNDLVDEKISDQLFLSAQDNNIGNDLNDRNFWIEFGPTIDLSNYYNKIQIDQKLILKADKTYLDNDFQKKLTAGTNINIDSNNVISSTGGSVGTNKHTELLLRDQPNQHNIDSITDLKDNLDTFTNDIQELAIEVDTKADRTYLNNDFQKKLTAGTNIAITQDNTINASDTNKHTDLLLKDEPNQHIIGSITGLTSNLEAIDTAITILNNKVPDNAVIFKWKGDWIAGTYIALDMVRNDKKIWVCIAPTTTDEPKKGSADWEEFNGELPTNLMTTDTTQTISGSKTFSNNIIFNKVATIKEVPVSPFDITNKFYVDGKAGDIFIKNYPCDIPSVSTNISSGNLIDIGFTAELVAEMMNTNKYYITFMVGTYSANVMFNQILTVTNAFGSTENKEWQMSCFNESWIAKPDFSETEVRISFLINRSGDLRFICKYAGGWNPNFRIKNLRLYKQAE